MLVGGESAKIRIVLGNDDEAVVASVRDYLGVIGETGGEDVDDELGVIAATGELLGDGAADVFVEEKPPLRGAHLGRGDAVRAVRRDLAPEGGRLSLATFADGLQLLPVGVVVRERLVDRRDIEVVVLGDRLGRVADLLDAIAELENRDTPPLDVWLVKKLLRDTGGLRGHSIPIYARRRV